MCRLHSRTFEDIGYFDIDFWNGSWCLLTDFRYSTTTATASWATRSSSRWWRIGSTGAWRPSAGRRAGPGSRSASSKKSGLSTSYPFASHYNPTYLFGLDENSDKTRSYKNIFSVIYSRLQLEHSHWMFQVMWPFWTHLKALVPT